MTLRRIEMRITSLIVVIAALCITAAAQQTGKDPSPGLLPGSIHGEIVIKEVSGNNLGKFSCSNLTVIVSELVAGGWQRKATATGSFSSRKCTFRVTNVPAGDALVTVLNANFPKACDEKKFDTTTSFPMTLKAREQLRYDFSVARIRCVLVK